MLKYLIVNRIDILGTIPLRIEISNYMKRVEAVCLTCFHEVFLGSHCYEHNYHCSYYYALTFLCSKIIRIVFLSFDRFYATVMTISE